MSKSTIHPTAYIESGAQLGDNTIIGPFCYIGSEVILGDNSEVMTGAVITGQTIIGENARIYPHAVLGGDPQTKNHKGSMTRLEIGRNCIIREGVTMNRGSDSSSGSTIIGNDCMFLAYSHVAHDCLIGNKVTFANNVMIGGHVVIGDSVIIGGGGAVHQFVRVGHHAFVGGLAALVGDLIPYGMAIGVHATLDGLNLIGMKRSGLDRSEIHTMRHAFVLLFDKSKPVRERANDILNHFPDIPAIQDMVNFIHEKRQRSLCTPHSSSYNDKIEN